MHIILPICILHLEPAHPDICDTLVPHDCWWQTRRHEQFFIEAQERRRNISFHPRKSSFLIFAHLDL
jgi:hypothetical protein